MVKVRMVFDAGDALRGNVRFLQLLNRPVGALVFVLAAGGLDVVDGVVKPQCHFNLCGFFSKSTMVIKNRQALSKMLLGVILPLGFVVGSNQ